MNRIKAAVTDRYNGLKRTDPRTKNLYASAALALPGFAASMAGIVMTINGATIKNCDKEPVVSLDPIVQENYEDLCGDLQGLTANGKKLMLAGGLEMSVVAAGVTYNDRRIRRNDGQYSNRRAPSITR